MVEHNLEESRHLKIQRYAFKMNRDMFDQRVEPGRIVGSPRLPEIPAMEPQMTNSRDQQPFSRAKSLVSLRPAVPGKASHLFACQPLQAFLKGHLASSRQELSFRQKSPF